jgi:hypothetical protein
VRLDIEAEDLDVARRRAKDALRYADVPGILKTKFDESDGGLITEGPDVVGLVLHPSHKPPKPAPAKPAKPAKKRKAKAAKAKAAKAKGKRTARNRKGNRKARR